MSSPAGLRFSRADFLARWTPSSTRAGVILSPGPPDMAASLGLAALEPDDSFGSDFAPLPGSADSSCLGGGDGPVRSPGGEQARDEGPVGRLSYEPSRPPQGRVDRLEGMADKAQDLPVMVKLDQLRKWQQHMQEQLKAHQLEELLRLQEEQQRLLGKMTGSQHGTGETSCLSGAEWEDDSFQGARDYTDSPPATCPGVPPAPSCGPQQDRGPSPAQSQERLPRGPGHPELEGEGNVSPDSWLSRGDDEEQDDTLTPGDGVAPTGDDSRDEVFYERPIKPGIGGRTKTFEELLEEQLSVEEQRMKAARQQQSQDGGDAARAPKRPFLKRGDGLSRFSNARQASLPKPGLKKVQARVMSRSHSEPTALQRGNILQRLPVQRKTATLNKENRLRGVSSPPQDVRVETKAPQTKILGSHQRHNTPEPIQTDTDGRKTKPPPPRLVKEQNNRKGGPAAQVARNASANGQQSPVVKQVGVSRGPEKAQHATTAAERWRGSTGGDGVPQEEASFQEKLRWWDCERRLESMELGEFELLEQAAEELSFSSNSSFVIKVLQMDQHHRGLHPRRLSSTPIKSTPMGAGECSSDGGSLNSVKTRDDALEEEQETHGDHDEVSSRSGSEVEDQDVAVKPPSFPSILCFPAHTNPPYDKRSYQDEDSCRGSASDGESTLMEEEGHQGRVVFDDDDTWNDLEDAVDGAANGSRAVSPDDEVTLPGRTLVKKGCNVVDLDQDTGPPPASQLMTRLFPSLKPKTQNAPLPPSPPHAASSESKKSEETTGQQVQSRQLRERLVELEMEIQRFKKENAALAALRRDNEETQQQLRKERSAFEQLKAEELAKFEEHKREENRKLQKERKLFERHAAAARAVPDKKEREEIQALKQQLSSLQEELRGREGRWASSHSRLRQQVDSLSQENASLRDEIRVLEKLRLSTLKKTAIITDDETKDGRSARDNSARDNSARDNSARDNSASSVAKGVKFASPLDSRGGTSSNSPPQSNAAAASTRSSKGASGMKSSLRRSSGPPSSSCSSLPGRRTEDSRNQDKPPHQDSHDYCPKGGFLSGEAEEPEPTEEVVCPPDGKVETVLAGGDRLIVFNNGTKKEVSADGLTVKVTFFNGDTKEVTADQRVIYFYADAKTTHITYPDGMEVLHFPNNQTEKLFPDGRKEITFPDQTVKNLFPGGGEESVLTDGTIIRVNPDATKEILFNTGQKEIHTADYKRREYPDGTVKTVYADGRQETRYPTGRLRIKDRDGNVLLDNGA